MTVAIVDARGDVDVDANIGLQTAKSRDLVIGFQNDTLHTRAQLMLPTVSDGPFPGVLSGANEICPYRFNKLVNAPN
jgi:hypothetical protein